MQTTLTPHATHGAAVRSVQERVCVAKPKDDTGQRTKQHAHTRAQVPKVASHSFLPRDGDLGAWDTPTYALSTHSDVPTQSWYMENNMSMSVGGGGWGERACSSMCTNDHVHTCRARATCERRYSGQRPLCGAYPFVCKRYCGFSIKTTSPFALARPGTFLLRVGFFA